MLAICPKCKRTITVDTHGRQHCKFCGKSIWVPDPMNPDAPPEEYSAQESAPDIQTEESPKETTRVPWEMNSEMGFFRRFFSTIGKVLFRHKSFFEGLSDTPVDRRTMTFGLLVLSLGLIQFFQFQAISIATMKEVSKNEKLMDDVQRIFPFIDKKKLEDTIAEMEKMKMNDKFFFLSSILAPLFALIVIWITTRVFLAGYIISKKSLPASLHKIRRIVCYSYTPWLFLAIPFLPVVLGVIWTLIIQYSALKRGIGLSRNVSFFVVALNLFLLKMCFEVWLQIHFFMTS